MIERTEIQGIGKVTVVYITSDFEPCSKEDADLIKVIPDDGSPIFLSTKEVEN